MTWHRWAGKLSFLRCGSCGYRLTAGQIYARLSSGLIRCEGCADDLATVSAWPRQAKRIEEDARHAPAPTLPGAVDYSSPSQPWAAVGSEVMKRRSKLMERLAAGADVKARQAGDR